jgi:hypothetical protein
VENCFFYQISVIFIHYIELVFLKKKMMMT